MKMVIGSDKLAAAAEGAASAAGAPLERLDVKPVHNASKGFVNDGTVDVCEFAIVTMLQAAAYGKPVALLPVTTLGRYQHQTLVTCSDLTVEDIEGKTVGVRSWSQTTGVWNRRFLAGQVRDRPPQAGLVHVEEGHVDEHQDPAWVKRAPAGHRLQADFLEGRLDYGIMGTELPSDERIRTAIKDAGKVAEEWSLQKGFAPVNHVVGVEPPGRRRSPGRRLRHLRRDGRNPGVDRDEGTCRLHPCRLRRAARRGLAGSRLRPGAGGTARPVDFDEA